DATAAAARRFFERRLSLITRAFGSPKTPHTVDSGRNPGKRYASHSRRLRFVRPAIHTSCQMATHAVMQNPYTMHRFVGLPADQFTHSIPRRPSICIGLSGSAHLRKRNWGPPAVFPKDAVAGLDRSGWFR